MVTALIDAGNSMDVTWVAMTMTEGDRLAVQQQGELLQSPLRGQKMQLRYVPIAKAAYRKHYDKISNELLWFLQHYMYDPTEDSPRQLQDAWINGYSVANQAIADAICAEIEREDTVPVVMLHDYHLYLVSSMIRKRHPGIVTQQFIHIPWPDIRCWHFLPSNIAQAIYSGLAGNDILGFQTERDARNFLEVHAQSSKARSGGKGIVHRPALTPFQFLSPKSDGLSIAQQGSVQQKRFYHSCVNIRLCALTVLNQRRTSYAASRHIIIYWKNIQNYMVK